MVVLEELQEVGTGKVAGYARAEVAGRDRAAR